MNITEARQLLQDHDIRFVLAQFVDIHGIAKAKAVPVDHFDEILDPGAGFAGFAIEGLGMQPHGPDYRAVGDLDTLTPMPWQPGYARIACDGYILGRATELDSRVALKRQLQRLQSRGLTFYTGLEPEFSLLTRGADGRLAPYDGGARLAEPCYDHKGLTRSSAYLDRLVASLKTVGMDVYQIDHEDANGQFEINYTHTDCLRSCDHYIIFRMAATEIAHQMGLICSFMPKPFANLPGNGMHMNMSLGDAKHPNLFADRADPRGLGLSPLAYHFLAGVLRHAPALAALCAPTVNSYKRLVVGGSRTGGTWAPAYISYGANNRSALVRVPGGYLELRLPDGACNPYLATAGVLAAGLDGIERDLEPGEPHHLNLYDMTPAQLREAGIGILPQNLHDAILALEADTALCEALGPIAVEFIKLKHLEWIEYMRHVSDWELDAYLEAF